MDSNHIDNFKANSPASLFMKQTCMSNEFMKPLTVETQLWCDNPPINNHYDRDRDPGNCIILNSTNDTKSNIVSTCSSSLSSLKPPATSEFESTNVESRPQTRALTRATLKNTLIKTDTSQPSTNAKDVSGVVSSKHTKLEDQHGTQKVQMEISPTSDSKVGEVEDILSNEDTNSSRSFKPSLITVSDPEYNPAESKLFNKVCLHLSFLKGGMYYVHSFYGPFVLCGFVVAFLFSPRFLVIGVTH